MTFLAILVGFLLLMIFLPAADPTKEVTSEMRDQATISCESELPLLATTYVVN
jgi:hypothetical protein